MEVKDKLKPYLGTKTILIIDSEEDWLQIYNKLRKQSSVKFAKDVYNSYNKQNCLAILFEEKGFETRADLNYFKCTAQYKSYNFIHSKDLLNTTRKYNLWKLKLTTS